MYSYQKICTLHRFNWPKRVFCSIGIERKNVNGCTSAVMIATIESGMTTLAVLIKIDHYHSDVVMKVTPYSLANLFYIVISCFLLPCSLMKSGSDQSFCYSLHEFQGRTPCFYTKRNEVLLESILEFKELTALGFLNTISTAASSLNCSQSPSDANIKNKSSDLSVWTRMDGSAVMTGLFNGRGETSCWNNGSLLNSGFFR